jgi:hypothetical protein
LFDVNIIPENLFCYEIKLTKFQQETQLRTLLDDKTVKSASIESIENWREQTHGVDDASLKFNKEYQLCTSGKLSDDISQTIKTPEKLVLKRNSIKILSLRQVE